ncbi:hypothetical protein [Pelobacter seleniigenes]|uniref:hypothetical protein n=1 Tax=Pelobacter seleniigenes TaxID=407188 RepID=UPI0004A750DD|nr:hypothetical protein [Pelobacter seleniigenes]
MTKEITIILYRRNFTSAWRYAICSEELAALATELDAEFRLAGVGVSFAGEAETGVDVRGYGDLLNAVRLRSSEPGSGTPCLGHIIGASTDCELLADIRKGVSRLAFAPETIRPEDAHRKVCHNCGCGC